MRSIEQTLQRHHDHNTFGKQQNITNNYGFKSIISGDKRPKCIFST